MLKCVSKRAGWLPTDEAEYPRTKFVGYGLVQGDDLNRAVKLVDLLDGAKARCKASLVERGKADEWTAEELENTAEALGYGAVKYAHLKKFRVFNYTFDFDEMLNDKGDTGVYLLCTHAQICSVINKSGKNIDELKKVTPLPIFIAFLLNIKFTISHTHVHIHIHIIVSYSLTMGFIKFFFCFFFGNRGVQPILGPRFRLSDLIYDNFFTYISRGPDGHVELVFDVLSDPVDAALEMPFIINPGDDVFKQPLSVKIFAYYGLDNDYGRCCLKKSSFNVTLLEDDSVTMFDKNKIPLNTSVLAVPAKGSLIIDVLVKDSNGNVIVKDIFDFPAKREGSSSITGHLKEADISYELKVNWKYEAAT